MNRPRRYVVNVAEFRNSGAYCGQYDRHVLAYDAADAVFQAERQSAVLDSRREAVSITPWVEGLHGKWDGLQEDGPSKQSERSGCPAEDLSR